ncbi:KTSC domain-containing protein [Streptomyces microflavus]|uniref:KTSC domain-containing protein n=1 Tax=Streptomyces microflavus TaxID=1919 RepID=UPI00339FB75B
MQRHPVISSNIKSIGYDHTSSILEVEFFSGVYHYHSVPETVFSAFLSAASHGRYFAQVVKDRYSYTRVR